MNRKLLIPSARTVSKRLCCFCVLVAECQVMNLILGYVGDRALSELGS